MTLTLTLTDTEHAPELYAAAEDRISYLAAHLDGFAPPARRAVLLWDLAVQTAIQSENHTSVCGRDPISEEFGQDMADALRVRAVLASAIAATEHALATGSPRVRATEPVIEVSVGGLLDALATVRSRDDRARLLEAVYEALRPAIGNTAASVALQVAYLYAPHRSGL